MGTSPTNIMDCPPEAELRTSRTSRTRVVTGAAVAAIVVFLSFAGFVVNRFVLRHNFHTVSEGQVYRCAQLDAAGLTALVQEHGIKSILNLRGGASGDGWYQAETNAAYQLGVRHYDYELSASSELSDAQLDSLVEMLRDAPKPLLVHCKSGADRTGLVGALYLYSFEGKSAETAGQELNLLYGHVPYLFWQDTAAMDKSFSRYVQAHPPGSARKSNSHLSKQETPSAAPGAN